MFVEVSLSEFEFETLDNRGKHKVGFALNSRALRAIDSVDGACSTCHPAHMYIGLLFFIR